MTKKIIFSSGGTGGHIFPAINLMKHFFDKGYEVLLVTDKRGNNFIKKYSKFKSYVLNLEYSFIKLFPLLSVTNKTLCPLSKKCFIKFIAGKI